MDSIDLSKLPGRRTKPEDSIDPYKLLTRKIDWSQSPQDLLTFISKRFHTHKDFFKFELVCKSWRESSVLKDLLIPKLPFLSVSAQENEKSIENYFLGFTRGGIYKEKSYDCIGSKGNWVITMDMDLNMHILNPFSRVQFDLPPNLGLNPPLGKALKEMRNTQSRRKNGVRKVVLSEGNRLAAAIHSISNYVSVAVVGDVSWTSTSGTDVDDIIILKKKLYAVTNHGSLLVWDIDSEPLQARVSYVGTYEKNLRFERSSQHSNYLVEIIEELVLVPVYQDIGRQLRFPFELFKFDFDSGEWENWYYPHFLKHSLFLGSHTSVMILVSEKSIFEANCIYLTMDEKKVQAFDLWEGEVKLVDDKFISSCPVPPPYLN